MSKGMLVDYDAEPSEVPEETAKLFDAAWTVCDIIIRMVRSGAIEKGHPGATRIVENLMWLLETGELPNFDVKSSKGNLWNTPS